MEPKQPGVMEAFTELSDPRWRKCRYPLDEILLVALSATLCGVEDWETMTLWGRSQLAWLQRLLPFAHGIPSPDTFRRVFAALNPKTFEQCFTAWVGTLCPALEGKHVAIDGKSVRGNRNGDTPALHLVSAWRSANGLTLGQIGTEQKSNEITAIPELLRALKLKGATVTIDAMGWDASTRLLTPSWPVVPITYWRSRTISRADRGDPALVCGGGPERVGALVLGTRGARQGTWPAGDTHLPGGQGRELAAEYWPALDGTAAAGDD